MAVPKAFLYFFLMIFLTCSCVFSEVETMEWLSVGVKGVNGLEEKMVYWLWKSEAVVLLSLSHMEELLYSTSKTKRLNATRSPL